VKQSQLEILPPNNPEGFHQRRGERIERRCIEIGKAKCQDFITESTLVECDIRILCGAGSVNLFASKFERCTFRPRREMKNLRFVGMTLRECTFLGRYSGCRFGNIEPQDAGAVTDCDFSQASLFHLCDFLAGAEIASIKWPSWPHIIVTDLERSAPAWRSLKLPEELQIVQQTIGQAPPAKAVTLYLPAETERAAELRAVFSAQPYIIVAPGPPVVPS
jgi:hypothetical protein